MGDRSDLELATFILVLAPSRPIDPRGTGAQHDRDKSAILTRVRFPILPTLMIGG